MKQKNTFKQKVHSLLYKNKAVLKFIYALIVLNIIALVLESFKDIRLQYSALLRGLEIFSIIVFTLEYIGRIYVANIKRPGRKKFIFSFYGIVDLLAIVPFYLPYILNLDLRVLRILRLFRFIRIFKLGRFNNSFRTINLVLSSKKNELLMTVFIAFVLLLISSTLMYYIETDVQPEKFKSIPHAFWWAIATLTTVGYGDVYPITAMGKFLGSFIAIIGIGFVALPTGILSSAFMEKIKKDDQSQCPHCGKRLSSEH